MHQKDAPHPQFPQDFRLPPATWPEADFIIGNPPFLGSKMFRQNGLDDAYVQAMYDAYDLPKTSDLCCYWFEEARRAVASAPRGRRRKPDGETPPSVRVGLLATQGIRGGDNRTVLERVKEAGDIFMAWSDREWILDGAAVHVSMVGFDDGTDKTRTLDGRMVVQINADLATDMDASTVASLPENSGLGFQGPVKVGDFDLAFPEARKMLAQPNPNSRSSAEVVRRWVRGEELNKRCEPVYIIDFAEMDLSEASQFERPFEHVVAHVKGFRERSTDRGRRTFWWRLGRSGADFRSAVGTSPRYLATCQTAKYRIFSWQPADSLPAQTVIAFGRSDDYFFGVLHSSVHELWALRMGTQLEDRPRYTPTTCFETFPLPWPPGSEPRPSGSGPGSADKKPLPYGRGSDRAGREVDSYQRISAAAAELNEQRERWLNPPEWIADWGRLIDARDKFADVPAEARPLLRHSAIMAEAARDPRFKKRTLTHLYNERPTWLKLAHEKLDRAVLAAYAAVDPAGGWSEDWATVWTETGAGHPPPGSVAGTEACPTIRVAQASPPANAEAAAIPAERAAAADLAARRKEIDQRVLANLLRLNLARAGAR